MNFPLNSEHLNANERRRSYRQLNLESIDLEPHDFDHAHRLSRQFSDEPQQWQAYLNTLALCALKKWLGERNLTLSYDTNTLIETQVLCSTAVSPLNIENFKLCLLTNQSLEEQEVSIPYKMIHSPRFFAHFYILMQVSVESEQAILIGFIRYDQLMKQSLKRTKSGNYQLSLADLNCEPSHFALNLKYLVPAAIALPEPTKVLAKLTSWLDSNILTAGWQSLQELLGNRQPILQMSDLTIPMRSESDDTTENQPQKAARRFLRQFQDHPILGDKTQGELSNKVTKTEVSNLLVQLLETTKDEETRWQAAELLWEIDPNHPATGVQRAIDLGMQLAGASVALMVAILQKPDQRIAILIRVYPLQEQCFLPANLKLIGLDEEGLSLFEVRARDRDDYIQFKFTADPEDRFSLEVVLDDATITKHFVV
ncbi:MAG: DUF1822 family protein [Cyanobacteria bacterium J06592_8]